MMSTPGNSAKSILLPLVVALVMVALWAALWASGAFHESALPSPQAVLRGFGEELGSGRLLNDLITSLFRVSCGFGLAVLLGIPLGLWMGQKLTARLAFLPIINFFRNLSPLAWIPFAILWFGVGDKPAIFIIFIATFFQIALATSAAAGSVPKVYYRVAEDLGLRGRAVLMHVTLPAILPQLVTALRVAIGVAWMVVVAAEMIAVNSGLGYLIIDGRNALRWDRVVCGMITIGAIGILLDIVFARLAKIPSVRWGFER